jgi:hypothetical protein
MHAIAGRLTLSGECYTHTRYECKALKGVRHGRVSYFEVRIVDDAESSGKASNLETRSAGKSFVSCFHSVVSCRTVSI